MLGVLGVMALGRLPTIAAEPYLEEGKTKNNQNKKRMLNHMFQNWDKKYFENAKILDNKKDCGDWSFSSQQVSNKFLNSFAFWLFGCWRYVKIVYKKEVEIQSLVETGSGTIYQ